MQSQANTYYNSYGLVTKSRRIRFRQRRRGSLQARDDDLLRFLSNHIVNRPSSRMVYNATGNPSDCSGTSGLVAKTTYSLRLERQPDSRDPHQHGRLSLLHQPHLHLRRPTACCKRPPTSKATRPAYTNTACSNSFPTTITPPITSLALSLAWDCNGGVVTSITDPNSQTTNFSYTAPTTSGGSRKPTTPTEAKPPSLTPNAASNFSIATSRLVSSGLVITRLPSTWTVWGAWTNPTTAQASSEVDTTYDSLGRVHTVSNPYCQQE